MSPNLEKSRKYTLIGSSNKVEQHVSFRLLHHLSPTTVLPYARRNIRSGVARQCSQRRPEDDHGHHVCILRLTGGQESRLHQEKHSSCQETWRRNRRRVCRAPCSRVASRPRTDLAWRGNRTQSRRRYQPDLAANHVCTKTNILGRSYCLLPCSHVATSLLSSSCLLSCLWHICSLPRPVRHHVLPFILHHFHLAIVSTGSMPFLSNSSSIDTSCSRVPLLM